LHSTDSVHRFLNRLNHPTQHQSTLQSQSSLLPHQARLEMQSQSQSKPAWQLKPAQSRPLPQTDPKAGPEQIRQQLSDASCLPRRSGFGGTHSLTPGAAVRQTSDRQTDLQPGTGWSTASEAVLYLGTPGATVRQTSDGQTDLRPGTGGSTLLEGELYQGRLLDQADVAGSPVQAAVAAVAGRLHSVQQGLASAEGRLAELTGRRPVKR